MDNLNLSRDVKFVRVANAAAAGTTEIVSAVIDTRGFSGVAFVALLGEVTAGSVLDLTLKTSDANSTAGATTTALTSRFTAGATDADNKVMLIDAFRPRQRYAFASLARGTANAAVDGILAILYNSHEVPLIQDPSVLTAVFRNDPAPA